MVLASAEKDGKKQTRSKRTAENIIIRSQYNNEEYNKEYNIYNEEYNNKESSLLLQACLGKSGQNDESLVGKRGASPAAAPEVVEPEENRSFF